MYSISTRKLFLFISFLFISFSVFGQAPSITTQPSTDTVCVTSNNSFSVVATNTTSYQWQVSTNSGSTWSNLSNGGVYSNVTTSAMAITSATSSMNGYQYRCVCTGSTSPAATSNAATLVVNALPTITSVTGATVCSGTSAQVSAAASTGASVTWHSASTGGSQLDTGSIYNISSATSTTTYYAQAEISYGGGASPDTAQTPYNSNNGQRGAMFDVTTGSSPITVTHFDCNLYAGTTADYEIYYRAGTHVGHENNSASWTYLGGATGVTSAGTNVPTLLPIYFSVTIPANTRYSFYITNDFGAGTSYTDGTAVGNYLASNGDVTFYEGVGKSYPFGLTFNVRNINCTMHYTKGGTSCSSSSRSGATVTVNTTANITSNPSNSSITSGNNTSFSIAATNATGYQWQVSTNSGSTWTNISNGGVYSNATTNTLSLTSASNALTGYQYRCIASTATSCNDTSTGAILTVTGTAPSISNQPANATVCTGNNAIYTINASNATSYQWQLSTNSGSTWSNVSNGSAYTGATTSTLTVTNPPITYNGYQYRCVATGSVSPAATSNSATLTVNVTINIVLQPPNTTVCAGSNTTISLGVVGSPITYQWQVSTNSGSTWSNLSNGGVYSNVTGPNLTFMGVTTTYNGYQYRCVVSGACGNETTTAATLTVNPATSISTQPVNSTVCSGGNTSFSVAASGTSLSYQWQVSTNSGSTWANVSNSTIHSNATTSTLNLTGATSTYNGYQYRCVVSGTCGNVNSSAATLTVNSATSITSHPGSIPVCSGANTFFSVAASGLSLTYQWQVSTNFGSTWSNLSNGGIYSNVTTSTLNITAATTAYNTYQYRCVVSGTCGNANSAAAMLTVYPTTSVSAQPNTVTVCTGNNTSFSVTASGASLTYQWQFSINSGSTWTNLLNGGIFSNTTTSTLNLTGVTSIYNNYRFRCVVSGTCGSANSSMATLNVDSPPSISSQPTNKTIGVLGFTSYSVTASNASSYQWQESINGGSTWSNITGGLVYSGATTSTLTLTSVPLTYNGYQFRCNVSGSCAPSATSNVASLTVGSAPTITTHPSNDSVCSGKNATFTVAASNATGYQWQVSTNNGATYSSISNSSVYSGVTTATLTITNATSTLDFNRYRCIVSGVVTPYATSNAGILIIKGNVSISTYHLRDETVCAGTGTTFPLTSAYNVDNFQWQVSTNSGSSWSNISNGSVYSGVDNDTLTVLTSTVSMNGYQYRCLAMGCDTQTSNTFSLTVHTTPTFTGSPVLDDSVVCGNITSTGTFTFGSSAIGAGGYYEWYYSGDNGATWNGLPVTSTPSVSFTPFPVFSDTYLIFSRALNTCDTVSTDTVKLVIKQPPSITTNPSNVAVCSGGNASLGITTSGDVTTYQWQVSTNSGATWTNISNGGVYSNATTDTLVITGATSTLNNNLYRCTATGMCSPSATSGVATLSINSAPSITTHPSNTNVCPSGNANFTVTASGSGLTYQWQLSTNSGTTWTNLSNSVVYTNVTSSTINITGATSAINNYQYRCVVSGTCTPSDTSNAATISINSTLSISTQPMNSTICSGGNTSFGVIASGTGLTYQWQENTGSGWSNLSNAGIYSGVTTNTLNVAGATSSANGNQYRCVISSSCTAPTNSNAATLFIEEAPSITTHPFNSAICSGSGTSFSVAATGAALTYQWQENIGSGWNNVVASGTYSGETTNTLTLASATSAINNYQYRCVVNGTCTPSATSNAATLTINSAPSVSTHPMSTTVCAATNTSFSVTASGAGLTYQWQENTGSSWSNLSNGGIYSNVTTSTLNMSSVSVAESGFQYRCVVSGTCTPSATSNAATLTVNSLLNVTSQPVNSTICSGNNTSFSVAASAAGLTYQWQENTGSGWANLSNASVYGGVNTSTLNLTAVTTAYSNYQYRCVLSSSCSAPVNSTAATLTVNAAPSITTQPNNSTICLNTNTSFSLSATGTGLTYQWEVNSGSGWSNVTNSTVYSGATASILSLTSPSAALSSNQYRCIVGGTCVPGVTSNVATLTVNIPPSITTQSMNSTICSGSNTSFTIAATGTSLSYQWEVNSGSGWSNVSNFGIYSGATTLTLALTSASTTVSGNQYRCVVSGTCTPNVTSNAVSLTVNSSPSITTQPSSSTICLNANTSFSVAATGTGLTYQWQENSGSGWNNVTNTGVYSGTTSSILSLTSPQVSLSANQYRCVIGGACVPGVTTNAVTLTINTPPSITTHPVSSTICSGGNTSFTIAATGTGLAYQWQSNTGSGWNNVSNSGIYSGATTTTLNLSAATASNSNTQYRCVVSGTCTPTATSSVASLTVNTSPSITMQPSSSTICEGANTALSVAAMGTGLTYQWEVNSGSGWSNLSNGGVYSGATTALLSLSAPIASMSGTQYRCAIGGTCTPSITTSVVSLTVNTLPIITTQPVSSTICSGNNTSFSVGATGTGLTYQWQSNSGGGWNNVSNSGIYTGATTNTLNLTSATTSSNTNQYRCIVSGTCTPSVTSNAVTLTVNALPAITTQPSASVICEHTNTTFTVGATGTGLTYQWEVNNGTSWSNVTNSGIYSGATTSVLSLTGATIAVHNYQYRCLVSGTCTPSVTSNVAALTIQTAPVITTDPASKTICEGLNHNFSVVATGTSLTYQWQVNSGSGWQNVSNGGVYSNATTSTIGLTNIPSSYNGNQYRCIVSGACTPNDTSATVVLTVYSNPNIITQPSSSKTICSGDNTSFSLSASGTGLSYQWIVYDGTSWSNVANGSVYSGATTNSLSINGATATTSALTYRYYCKIVGTCDSVNSDTSTLIIRAKPSIVSHPNNATICDSSNNVSFAVSATGTGLNYQWQQRSGTSSVWSNVSNSANISGAQTATMTISQVYLTMSNSRYRCIVSGACSPSVTSNIAILTVIPLRTPTVNITATSNDICVGNSVTFTPSHSYGGSTPSYRWRVNGSNVATGNTYTITSLSDGDIVTAIMTSSYACPRPATDTSNEVKMKVTPYSTPIINISTPTGNKGCLGRPVTFYSQSTNHGSSASYVWQVNGNVVGGNADTLSYLGLLNGDDVSCVMTSSIKCPSPKTVNSNTITMDMIKVTTADIVISAGPDTDICVNEKVTLYSAFTNGGNAPKYQWVLNGNDLPGETNATMVISTLKDIDLIQCRFTSSARCVFPELSKGIYFSVGNLEKPEVDVAVYSLGDDTYMFEALPNKGGIRPKYQWFNSGRPITGETDSIYIAKGLKKFERITVQMASSLPCVTSKAVMSRNITTGVGTLAKLFDDISLYPNPNSGLFTLNGQLKYAVNSKEVHVRVTNSLGQEVFNDTYVVKGKTLDISVAVDKELAEGMYMLNVNIDGQITTMRFVVNK